MTEDMYIINTWLCRVDKDSVKPLFGDLHIRNGTIQKFTVREYPQMIEQKQDSVTIDACGRVITLPLVNFHDHIYSRLARGVPVSGGLKNFTRILEGLWWILDRALDSDMIKACAELAARESIRQGVTYIFDHHASPSVTDGSLTLIKHILDKNHIRGVLCCEISDRNGPDAMQKALHENEHFIRSAAQENLKGMIGLHAPFTLSEQTLLSTAKLLHNLDTSIHIHIAEDKIDVTSSHKKFDTGPAQRLYGHGLLTKKAILAHGIHLEKSDLFCIRDAGSAIVFNPDSNLNNSVGLPKYAKIPTEIPLLAGTDGMHANISRSLKQLFLLYRMQGNSFGQAFSWIHKIYFDQLRFVQRWFDDFSCLCEGDRADLVMWDYLPPTPFHAENFWGHFLYGILESPVHSVVQGGRILMRNFCLENDIDQLLSEFIFRKGQQLYNQMKDAL